jgi:hypothetical protein
MGDASIPCERGVKKGKEGIALMDWDVVGAIIAVFVSSATFLFAMRIVRLDLARSEKELALWKTDVDRIETHDRMTKLDFARGDGVTPSH